jgi:hypothetical protein
VDSHDFPGVIRAAGDLRIDIERVTGIQPHQLNGITSTKTAVIVGTIGKNALINQLIKSGKLKTDLEGRNEKFITTVVSDPFPGVDQALVIAGSDKRGTIYGIYDLSQQIGVSPWYWWADVPVKKQSELYVIPGTHTQGEPAVQYRGIFINDEQPALGGWVRDNTGGFNSKFYVKVFELILRMKGNFLWPAMWGQSFFSDDTLSHRLADEYGIVIGTSHHEPLMRAHVEWQREGGGKWNYQSNPERLREFWREGISRMNNYESIVTLAMRGDGDEPMSEDSNVKLLQKIVADQRQIIAEVTKKDITKTPQVWALYKEVQDYYDKGMRVPDDVTLLLCDDNWGNIRKLPSQKDLAHPGGYGVYYHYDYVGGPRNYKWLNTNPIAKVWEQMNLAYEYKATKIWIVNVGDIKPVEFPIEFFLDFAWNPEKWPQDKLQHYTELWATREFGSQHSEAIARIMSAYTKFNGRRKPELLGPDSFSPELYSLTDYDEAERIVKEYNTLAAEAETIYNQLPEESKAAYYQLIFYPVLACANLNEMYYHVRMNTLCVAQGRVSGNEHALLAQKLFERDSLLSVYYNKTLSGGKWNHLMDQLHIGYKGWHDDFKVNHLPEMKLVKAKEGSIPALVLEGNSQSYKAGDAPGTLPLMDAFNRQNRELVLFNQGQKGFVYKIKCSEPAMLFTPASGNITKETTITVSANWDKLASGRKQVPVEIEIPGHKSLKFLIDLFNPAPSERNEAKGFSDAAGFISIEAAHFSRTVNYDSLRWTELPDHGRTLSAIAVFPVAAPVTEDFTKSPYVEYDLHFFSQGKAKTQFYLSPAIDFTAGKGLRFAVSLDNNAPIVINMHEQNTQRDWEESVKNNIRIATTEFDVSTPGRHTLRVYRIDPGVVLQKIVIDTGGLKPSYLGPPESVLLK